MLYQVLSFSNDVLYDALPYALVCLGIMWTAKYIRFPDLTCSGTFVLGGALAALAIVKAGWPPSVALPLAVAGGVAGGLLTGAFHVGLRLDRMLAGILSAFVLYSINLLLLTPTLAYQGHATLFTALEGYDRAVTAPGLAVSWHPLLIGVMLLIVLVAKLATDWFLASEKGLALRALEDENAGESALLQRGLSPDRYRVLALVCGNGLIALAGALVSFKEGAANAHRGFDVLVTGLITFLLAAQLHAMSQRLSATLRSRGRTTMAAMFHLPFTTAAVLGAIAYFALLAISQRVEIDSAYAKILLAGFIAISAADLPVLRRRPGKESGARQTPELESGGEALRVRGLNYRYPAADIPTLKGLDIAVGRGEFVRLRGSNGSGKTTALRLIAGFLEADQGGRILLGARDLTAKPAERLRQVVYVDQDTRRGVLGILSPLENLALASVRRPSAWRRALPAAKAERLNAVARSGGMPDHIMRQPAAHLSGGQRQVLNLLALLARDDKPDLVLLDEPANNLDAANQARCQQIIRALHREGAAILLVSHSDAPAAPASRDVNLDRLNSMEPNAMVAAR